MELFLIKGLDQGARGCELIFLTPAIVGRNFDAIWKVQLHNQLRQTGRIDHTFAVKLLQDRVFGRMQALKLPTVITGFFGVMNIVGNIRNFQLNQSHKNPIDGWANWHEQSQ